MSRAARERVDLLRRVLAEGAGCHTGDVESCPHCHRESQERRDAVREAEQRRFGE